LLKRHAITREFADYLNFWFEREVQPRCPFLCEGKEAGDVGNIFLVVADAGGNRQGFLLSFFEAGYRRLVTSGFVATEDLSLKSGLN
jgi:hypothetical protein